VICRTFFHSSFNVVAQSERSQFDVFRQEGGGPFALRDHQVGRMQTRNGSGNSSSSTIAPAAESRFAAVLNQFAGWFDLPPDRAPAQTDAQTLTETETGVALDSERLGTRNKILDAPAVPADRGPA